MRQSRLSLPSMVKLSYTKGKNHPKAFILSTFRRNDRNTGRPQAFCFITFKDDQVATKLCKLHWMDVLGKKCEIKTGE